MSRKAAVIIVAAGSGSRFGGNIPKQFCVLGDKPVLMHSIERFAGYLPGAEITVVLSADRVDYWRELCRQYSFDVPHQIAIGGATRWESVKNALENVNRQASVIMIHDGARPLVERDTIARLSEALEDGAPGALPVIPMVDSLRHIAADGHSEAVDRSRFVRVQTPQAFEAAKLLEAYRLPYSPVMTDDASVFEMADFGPIKLVAGSEATLKITRNEDLAIAGIYLSR